MPDQIARQRKRNYINKLLSLIDEYKKILIVVADNVSSKQMTQVRRSLLGKAVILMGKKTLMRKALDESKEKNAKLLELKKVFKGNIGLVFTNGDPAEIRKTIQENRIKAVARQGAVSPCEVIIPKGNTGMEPTKTGFFQALDIPTKITKGTVDIVGDFRILKKGQKVGNSEAVLLQMLDIKPFSYGLEVTKVCEEGCIYDASVLDIADDEFQKVFEESISNCTNVSLATGYTTSSSVPIVLSNVLNEMLSVFCTFKNYETNATKQIKEFLLDPSKFKTAEVVKEKPKEVEKEKPKVVEEKKPVVEEKPAEEEDVGFGGLF